MKIAKNLIECCSMYISDIPQLVLPNKKAMSPLFKSVPLRALSTYFKSAVMLKAPSQFCSLGSNFFTNILEELTKSEALSIQLCGKLQKLVLSGCSTRVSIFLKIQNGLSIRACLIRMMQYIYMLPCTAKLPTYLILIYPGFFHNRVTQQEGPM